MRKYMSLVLALIGCATSTPIKEDAPAKAPTPEDCSVVVEKFMREFSPVAVALWRNSTAYGMIFNIETTNKTIELLLLTQTSLPHLLKDPHFVGRGACTWHGEMFEFYRGSVPLSALDENQIEL